MDCLVRSEARLKGKPKNPPASAFGVWIDQGLDRREWSIRELADASGVSQPRITQLRQGDSATRDMVQRLASGLLGPDADDRTAGALLNEGLRAAGFAPADDGFGSDAHPVLDYLRGFPGSKLDQAQRILEAAFAGAPAEAVRERRPTYPGAPPQREMVAGAKALEQVTRTNAADFRPGRAAPLGAGSVIWALDSQGRFLMSEGDDLPVENLKPGQAVGLRIWDVYRGEDDFLEKIKMVLASDSRLEWSTTVRGNQWICQTEPLRDAQGNKVGIVGASVQRLDDAAQEATGTGPG